MASLHRLIRSTTSSTNLKSHLRRGFATSASTTDASESGAFNPSLTFKKDPNDRNVQWIFLGCPGVGKGTYASRLSKLLGVPHIATGDLVREELSSSGPLAFSLAEIVNQGKLVSDEMIIKLLSKRLESGEKKGESGFILDGFPRTINQAEILNGVTDIDLVVNLRLREDVIVAKCLGRRICSECGKNFNVAEIDVKGENGSPGMYMAPLLPPAHCTTKMVTRADDTEEVVKKRLQIYNEMSQPVEQFYRSRDKLMDFDLPGGIPESWPKLLHFLNLEDPKARDQQQHEFSLHTFSNSRADSFFACSYNTYAYFSAI